MDQDSNRKNMHMFNNKRQVVLSKNFVDLQEEE